MKAAILSLLAAGALALSAGSAEARPARGGYHGGYHRGHSGVYRGGYWGGYYPTYYPTPYWGYGNYGRHGYRWRGW